MIQELQKITNKHSLWTLYDSIESFSDYTDLLKRLHNSIEGDTIVLLLNSPGGRCDIGKTIITAMKTSSAKIKCIVEDSCYSMASLIALAGDTLEMYENTFLMFHNYSTMYYGKGNEIELQSKAEKENLDKQMKAYCMPFLTEKECEKIINGEDLYIKWDTPSLKTRIKRHFK